MTPLLPFLRYIFPIELIKWKGGLVIWHIKKERFLEHSVKSFHQHFNGLLALCRPHKCMIFLDQKILINKFSSLLFYLFSLWDNVKFSKTWLLDKLFSSSYFAPMDPHANNFIDCLLSWLKASSMFFLVSLRQKLET